MLPGTVSPALHCRQLMRILSFFINLLSLSEMLEKKVYGNWQWMRTLYPHLRTVSVDDGSDGWAFSRTHAKPYKTLGS